MHDLSKSIHFSLDISYHLELRSCTNDVMLGIRGLKVGIAVQIVCKESHTALKAHELYRERKKFQFSFCDIGKFFNKAAGEVFEILLNEPDHARILLILRRAGRTYTESVSKVIKERARHYGIKVDYAKTLICIDIEECIIELSIVMSYAERKLAGGEIVNDDTHIAVSCHYEVDLILALVSSAGLILSQSLLEVFETNFSIMEVGDNLVELIHRKIRQHILKVTEELCCLIKDLGIVRHIIGERVIDKSEHTVHIAVFIPVISLALVGHKIMKGSCFNGAPGSEKLLADMGGYSLHVIHNVVNILENVGINLLEHIFTNGGYSVRVVDITAAVFLSMKLDIEVVDDVVHLLVHSFFFGTAKVPPP